MYVYSLLFRLVCFFRRGFWPVACILRQYTITNSNSDRSSTALIATRSTIALICVTILAIFDSASTRVKFMYVCIHLALHLGLLFLL